jgi:hypothetical protein
MMSGRATQGPGRTAVGGPTPPRYASRRRGWAPVGTGGSYALPAAGVNAQGRELDPAAAPGRGGGPCDAGWR